MYIYVYTHVFINVSSYSHIYKRFVPEGYLRKWISQQGQCIIPVNDLIRQTSSNIWMHVFDNRIYIYIYTSIYIHVYTSMYIYIHKHQSYVYPQTFYLYMNSIKIYTHMMRFSIYWCIYIYIHVTNYIYIHIFLCPYIFVFFRDCFLCRKCLKICGKEIWSQYISRCCCSMNSLLWRMKGREKQSC
jgi:hypothetical protein